MRDQTDKRIGSNAAAVTRRAGLVKIFLFAAVLVAVFGYAEPARAIYYQYGWKSYERGVGALVDSQGNQFCTASLITPQAILTAEHCLSRIVSREEFNSNYFVLYFPNNTSLAYRLSAALLVHNPPAIRAADNHDIAVILLANPVPSTQALPIPLGTVAPPLSDYLYIIGFGEIRPGETDGQYTGRARALQNIACYGDSGGPVIWNGTIVAVVSGGQLHGISLPNDQWCGVVSETPIYGQTLQYYDNIRVAMGAYNGPPYCKFYEGIDENISTIPDNLSTAFALGGTQCSYSIDTVFSRGISCLLFPFFEFSNTEAIYPGEHRFFIRAQNANGTATCDGGSFVINRPPDYPQASLNLNNSNIPVNGQVTANVAVVSCISPPCSISWSYQTAQAPAASNLFAMPADALQNLSSLFAGFIKSFPIWKP